MRKPKEQPYECPEVLAMSLEELLALQEKRGTAEARSQFELLIYERDRAQTAVHQWTQKNYEITRRIAELKEQA